MPNLIKWLESHVWPWKVIATLRLERDEAIRTMKVCYDTYIDGYNSHWNKWISTANTFYGPIPFTDSERSWMHREYECGRGWLEALERFRISRTPPRWN